MEDDGHGGQGLCYLSWSCHFLLYIIILSNYGTEHIPSGKYNLVHENFCLHLLLDLGCSLQEHDVPKPQVPASKNGTPLLCNRDTARTPLYAAWNAIQPARIRQPAHTVCSVTIADK